MCVNISWISIHGFTGEPVILLTALESKVEMNSSLPTSYVDPSGLHVMPPPWTFEEWNRMAEKMQKDKWFKDWWRYWWRIEKVLWTCIADCMAKTASWLTPFSTYGSMDANTCWI